jgi:hypothetical protein
LFKNQPFPPVGTSVQTPEHPPSRQKMPFFTFSNPGIKKMTKNEDFLEERPFWPVLVCSEWCVFVSGGGHSAA